MQTSKSPSSNTVGKVWEGVLGHSEEARMKSSIPRDFDIESLKGGNADVVIVQDMKTV